MIFGGQLVCFAGCIGDARREKDRREVVRLWYCVRRQWLMRGRWQIYGGGG